MNKNTGEIDGVSYSGWNEYYSDIDSNEMFKIIDAAIGSILDPTPLIETSENILWQQKSWTKLSELLSTGVVVRFEGNAVNIVGLRDTGNLRAYSDSSEYEISDVDDFSVTF